MSVGAEAGAVSALSDEVSGRIIVRAETDAGGQASGRLEVGFRPSWASGSGVDDVLPVRRLVGSGLLEERAGQWIRTSAMTVSGPDGSGADVELRLQIRAEANPEGVATGRIEVGDPARLGPDL